MTNKITVTSLGTTANVNATPDSARYYSDKSKEWAISDKLIDNEDYSSKYYANESKKQANIATAKTTEVIASGNNAVSNIESARNNAITDITNQENLSVDNVNTAGATQVALATEQANIATQQATIATNKASEVVASGNEALSNIDTAKTGAITDITDLKNDSISSMETAKSGALTEIETLHSSSVTDITGLKNTSITDITNLKNTSISNITTAKNNAITSITNQETTSKNVLIDEGATQIGLIQNEGATQVNLAKEQVTLATNQANIATEQATIATSQASIATSKTTEVVESGNTALSNIETVKSNALNDINTTGAEYVNNTEQYAQNALNSANNAKASEDNALSYKSSAMESSQTATEQANIATTSANNAKTSETNAKSSEVRCEEILSRLGTAIKIKGRVNSLGDLPLSGNLDGDTYLIGKEGLDSYPEYYWYQDHWEFLGTSGTTLSWGLITGNIKAQTDLQTELDTKQDVISDLETIRSNANLVTTKQDTIPDLATIRSGASKGATALQSIPAEYVTETELNAKGYLTSYTETDPIYTADKPNIALKSEMPTKTSQLTNDSDYITSSYHDSTKQDKLTAGDNIAIIDNVISAKGGGGLELCDIGMSLYIDETKGLRRYLNGQIVDINTNTQAFLNRLKQITTLHPSLLCTEDEWQTAKTMSVFGQVGKFVFNYSGDKIVSVRIPAIVNVQGLFDLQNLGMTVAAGLPTLTTNSTGAHTHTRGTMNITGTAANGYRGFLTGANGAIYGTGSSTDWGGQGSVTSFNGFAFDASRNWTGSTSSNGAHTHTIAGTADTVQQEAIQYPYFIQIATGAETENNIINEIELNNPYSLFDSKYSDHELNNLSWLKSEGQWNAKAVYPTAYDELLTEYNNSASTTETEGSITFKRTPKGYKIALANQETAIDTKYSTDGIAWYYILDTTNEKFKLPRTKFGFEGLRTSVGDDIKAGLPNITGHLDVNADRNIFNGGQWGAFYRDGSGGRTWAALEPNTPNSLGDIHFDASRSNPIYGNSNTVQSPATQMYLYFYVGETVQNANLIDAGRIGEQLATKTNMLQASGAGMPSNKYINLTLGASGSSYTAPANGWFYCRSDTSGAGGWMYAIAKNFNMVSNAYADNSTVIIFCPVLKGDSVQFSYSNSKGHVLRFIYAEGEV